MQIIHYRFPSSPYNYCSIEIHPDGKVFSQGAPVQHTLSPREVDTLHSQIEATLCQARELRPGIPGEMTRSAYLNFDDQVCWWVADGPPAPFQVAASILATLERVLDEANR